MISKTVETVNSLHIQQKVWFAGDVTAQPGPPQMPAEVSGRISYLLSRLGASARDRFAAALAPLGLRPNHYGALRLLQQHEPTSQQTLAAGLGVDRSVIVGIVDHLESLGAVERQPDPRDRRRHALHLTAAGRDLIKRADAIAEQLQEQRLAPLTAPQRRDLLTLLDILASHDLGSAATSAGTPHKTTEPSGQAGPG
jgi:DNA-binding MarR family transcriptional regulator